jgi:hypothetical protein
MIIVMQIIVDTQEDYEQLDRLLQKADCVRDYEFIEKYDGDTDDED